MKKYLLTLAVLAMGMTMFTSCNKDEEVLLPGVELGFNEPSLSAIVGETLTIAPAYTSVDKNTTYKWFVNGELVSSESYLNWTASAPGRYTIVLEVANGEKVVQKQFEVNVDKKTGTVTFEEDVWNALIPSGQAYGCNLIYGDEAMDYGWSDAVTGLSSTLTKAWGGSYGFAEGGVAISNYIDADLQNHASADYQLSVPVSNGSKNFAVVYCDAFVKFPAGVSRVIRSMQIGPTTYELGIVTNGDGYAASLAESGNLTITITADNGKTLDVDMARNGQIMTTWTTVDLSSLGAVNSLSFTMDGSDKSDYGVKHPKYFAFDNVVVEL